jgi:hypothetical protein
VFDAGLPTLVYDETETPTCMSVTGR